MRGTPHKIDWDIPTSPMGRSWDHRCSKFTLRREQRYPLPGRNFGVWEAQFPVRLFCFPQHGGCTHQLSLLGYWVTVV